MIILIMHGLLNHFKFYVFGRWYSAFYNLHYKADTPSRYAHPDGYRSPRTKNLP